MKYSKCLYCGAIHTGDNVPTNCVSCGAILPPPEYVASQEEFNEMVKASKTSAVALENEKISTAKELNSIYSDLRDKYYTAEELVENKAEKMANDSFIAENKRIKQHSTLFGLIAVVVVAALLILLLPSHRVSAVLIAAGVIGYAVSSYFYKHIQISKDEEAEADSKYLKAIQSDTVIMNAVADYTDARETAAKRLADIKNNRPALCELEEYIDTANFCNKHIRIYDDKEEHGKNPFTYLIFHENILNEMNSFNSVIYIWVVVIGIFAIGICSI